MANESTDSLLLIYSPLSFFVVSKYAKRAARVTQDIFLGRQTYHSLHDDAESRQTQDLRRHRVTRRAVEWAAFFRYSSEEVQIALPR